METFTETSNSALADPVDSPADRAVVLAEKLLQESLEIRTSKERAQMESIAGLVSDENSKSLSMKMTDRFWRSADGARTAVSWRHLLRQFGSPMGFAPLDRLLLSAAALASRFLPSPVVALIRARLRRESAEVILPAGEPRFGDYLRCRETHSVRLNINQLGEAVLGEEEAARRLQRVLELLARPDVNHVSVKLSAIFSQINVVAWETTLERAVDRLRTIYRAALGEGKFVNLDTEEYRDLALTVAAFRRVLDEPEFLSLSAGLVLQSYLPDSIGAQRELTAWAQKRCKRGGAPIKIRIVKGANLAMEKVEAEWHGWNQAPYPAKLDTDAAYKRMLEFACRPEHSAAVRVGVGSHNLFDIALALTLARDAGVEGEVEIEMLEGMASAQARAVQREAGSLLLYAPVVRDEDFGSALAYLVRRLDENTAPGNFLSDLFAMTPRSEAWTNQKHQFQAAWRRRRHVSAEPRRALPAARPTGEFSNEPDTDWTREKNREALHRSLLQWQPTSPPSPVDLAGIGVALERAREAQPAWESTGADARAAILNRCAQELAGRRFETLAILNREGKKAVPEADTEVSEAIDFARYYAHFGTPPAGLEARALGTVVVAPPWNFPYAIPCGGVLAALMAGNAVILKPAPEAVGIGWHLASQLWRAGVPREVLQFVRCEDGDTGRDLITDPRTKAVVLTGAWETAQMFREWRPSLRLFAETSGKNAIVVSALADRELAARDLVKSAFTHSGQKCSAASLGILEAEVYDDPVFRRQLRDAAASLRVGPAEDLSSVVTPLIQKPGGVLRRALTSLDDGEEWLLEPSVDPEDPCLWSPGIKLGVQSGSWFHNTEYFGPVLGLMRARNLEEAVAFQNGVDFGLTAGFQSLDEDEIACWQERVEAGNLYINRGITGAIVGRQPFGGWKRSHVGPGAKAGGPNYVNLFRNCIDMETTTLESAAADYAKAWRNHFSIPHDPSGLRCERNQFRYRQRKGVILRLAVADDMIEALACLASTQCDVPLVISRASEERADGLIQRLDELAMGASVLRTVGTALEDEVLRAAGRAGLNWIDAPLSAVGRLELTRWMEEQVVTETRHRYGNIFDDRR